VQGKESLGRKKRKGGGEEAFYMLDFSLIYENVGYLGRGGEKTELLKEKGKRREGVGN